MVKPPSKIKQRKFHVSTFLVYLFSSIAVTVPLCSFNSIKKELFLTSGTLSIISSRMTYGTAIGKCMACFTVDAFGARFSTLLSFCGLAFVLTLLSSTNDVFLISMACMFLEIANSSIYPSLVTRIGNWFRDYPEIVHDCCLVLSLSSRFQAMFIVYFYGTLLEYYTWRQVTIFAACVVVIGVVFCYFVLYDTPEKPYKFGQKLNCATVTDTLHATVYTNDSFDLWLVIIAGACCGIIRKFDSLIPVYISDTTTVSSTTAVRLAICHPAGYVSGLMICGYFINVVLGNQKLFL
eukprot:UN32570